MSLSKPRSRITFLNNLPLPRNHFYTGCEQVLEQLHTGFQQEHRRQAISGKPGAGKTQTALEYAYRHQREFSVVFWIKAHSRESLLADFASIAQLLNLHGRQYHDQSIAAEIVRQWLEKNYRWLLILDDVSDLEGLTPFLPSHSSGSSGQILLTAPDQQGGFSGITREVDMFSPKEGALFLFRRLKIINKDDSPDALPASLHEQGEALSKTLEGLPLALNLAAAYIDAGASSMERYLELYHRESRKLSMDRPAAQSDIPESIEIAISLSHRKLTETCPAAVQLLQLCSHLEADVIPEEIFPSSGTKFAERIGTTLADPLPLTEMIAEAERYSLLRENPGNQTLGMHSLVQTALRNKMKPEDDREWAARAIRLVAGALPQITPETAESCNRLILHAERLARVSEEFGLESADTAGLMNQTGAFLKYRAQYPRAESLLRRALSIREKVFGVIHPLTAQSTNHLAGLFEAQGDLTTALPLYKHSLRILENSLVPDHPDIATALNNLAGLYHSQGRYPKALPLFQRALAIRQKTLGPEHPDTARSLENLALLHETLGNYQQAEPLSRKALQIREKELGPDHPDTAICLNNLALLYSLQNKYIESESLYRRALSILEKTLGALHPDTATSINNLAALCRTLGKYSEAESHYLRALRILKKVVGPEHPDTATSLNNLATLYRAQQKYAEAQPLYRRAYQIFEKTLGPRHPDTLTVSENLIQLQQELMPREETHHAKPRQTREAQSPQ